MKVKTCPDCKFKIDIPEDWNFVFNECRICNEIRFDSMDLSDDGPPDPEEEAESLKKKFHIGTFNIQSITKKEQA